MSSINDISNTSKSLSSDTVPTSNIDRSNKYKYNPQVGSIYPLYREKGSWHYDMMCHLIPHCRREVIRITLVQRDHRKSCYADSCSPCILRSTKARESRQSQDTCIESSERGRRQPQLVPTCSAGETMRACMLVYGHCFTE